MAKRGPKSKAEKAALAAESAAQGTPEGGATGSEVAGEPTEAVNAEADSTDQSSGDPDTGDAGATDTGATDVIPSDQDIAEEQARQAKAWAEKEAADKARIKAEQEQMILDEPIMPPIHCWTDEAIRDYARREFRTDLPLGLTGNDLKQAYRQQHLARRY